MNETPPVSCICSVNGDYQLVEEAIFSFLMQDYAGIKELVILNDDDGQLLEISHPEIKIFNVQQCLRSEVERRNTAVSLCSHHLIFMWDAEDIYLPHRLSFSVKHFDENIGFFKMDEAFVWGNNRLSGLQKSVFHNAYCFSREKFDRMRGYPYMTNYGYDQQIEHRFKSKTLESIQQNTVGKSTQAYCIYRWENKAHNRPLFLSRKRPKAVAVKRKLIRLKPHWAYDYADMVGSYLTTAVSSYHSHNNNPTSNPVRVNFLIAGAQKSGTSALDSYLRLQPEVCMAGRKEVHFFDNERIFSEKTDFSSPKRFFPWFGLEGCYLSDPENFSGDKYDLYHSFFSPKPPQRVYGEATPECMYWYDAPRRIWEYNPEMKLIIILRNPIERAYSHWNMRRLRPKDKRENRPFRIAVERETKTIPHSLPLQFKERYIDRGFYTDQIRRIWHYFPKEQTLFLKNEELRHDLQTTMNKVCDFIGVDRLKNLQQQEVFSKPYENSLSNQDRNFLKNIYKMEIKKLEHLLNWDCSNWLN